MRRHAASRSAPWPSEPLRLIRAACAACALTIVASALSACGEDGRIPDPGPATGAEYRRLGESDRVAAARSCRDAAAARTSGLAARQIAQVDPALLRTELDLAIADDRHVTFRAACAAAVPLVTPGLKFKFAGVTGNGGSFSYPTRSDRPLTIRGEIAPVPEAGRVVARRLVGAPQPVSVPIDSRGGFEFRDLKLRKLADNTFLLEIDAPPNAPRVVRFSALCLDCLAGTASP
jgi:hypothetical protein